MRLFTFCISISVLFYCGCSDAAPKEKASELACPLVLPAEKDVPSTWAVIGKIPAEKLKLTGIGVIYGTAETEKSRLAGAKERIFGDEIIDEWEDHGDYSQAEMSYEDNHQDRMLKCIYSKSFNDTSGTNLDNVILLVPLPKKAITCVFIQRWKNLEPKVEASCKLD